MTTDDTPVHDRVEPMSAAVARERVLAEHGDLVETVLDCAEAVAAGWDEEATTDREQVVPVLRATLDRAGATGRLPGLLADAVRAAGFDLAAPPVAAPPYVTITSRGPVLRATVDDRRLVVTLAVFDIERDPLRYRRGAKSPEEAVRVALKR